jgi:hypothetical protein
MTLENQGVCMTFTDRNGDLHSFVMQKDELRQTGTKRRRYRCIGEVSGSKPPPPGAALKGSGYQCTVCKSKSHSSQYCLHETVTDVARQAKINSLIPCDVADKGSWITRDPVTSVEYILTQRSVREIGKLSGGAARKTGEPVILIVSPHGERNISKRKTIEAEGGSAARRLNINEPITATSQDGGVPSGGRGPENGNAQPAEQSRPCPKCKSCNLKTHLCAG